MKLYLSIYMTLIAAFTAAADAPKILTISPNFWATGVDSSSQRTASIVFDRPMRQGFSAWLGTSGVLPASQLQSANSEDGRTFTLSFSLAPGKVYVFALNEPSISGVGFQSPRGVPLPTHFLVFQTAGAPKPEDAPPRVASTIPANDSQQIDPSRLKALTVNFDKPMRTAKHGLHMWENKKEVDLSKASFLYSGDGKSFTLNYDFKPSSTYELQLNSTQDIGFVSVQRIPLWPVGFRFSTGSPR